LPKIVKKYFIQILFMNTVGEIIRKLREEKEMPLRKLAALLDIDQSTLSKIERNERNANEDMITKIAQIFDTDFKTLKINLLSDRIAYDLLDETLSDEVLKVAEEKILYLKNLKK
jgi:HTH-type transcriptional regulator, competence development regulator